MPSVAPFPFFASLFFFGGIVPIPNVVSEMQWLKHTRKNKNQTNLSENDSPLQGLCNLSHDAEFLLW
jgi:hypothetical protein